MALQPDSMIREALAQLDEGGLEQLTVRRLAERLGVQNPALYWHFKDKQALLNAMAARLLEDAFDGYAPNPKGWQETLVDLARRLRRGLLAHRDGARLIAGAALTDSALHRAQALARSALIATGFKPAEALAATVTLLDYTLGASFEEQAEPDDPGSTKESSRRARGFETGVAIILAGVAAQQRGGSARIIPKARRARAKP